MSKQLTLLGVVVAVAVVLSGCSAVTSDTLEFAASPASPSDAALSETGYELTQNESRLNVRNVSAAGQEKTVRVTSEIRVYRKSLALGPLGERDVAAFAVISTPAVRIAGQSFNPIGEQSNEELVTRFAGQFSNLRDVRSEGSQQLSVLGSEATVSAFSATTTVQGQDVRLRLHVTKIDHEGDIVVLFGAYPERVSGEEENVLGLMGAVEHATG